MTRDRVTCQVTVSTPVYPVYRCMLLGQVSRRRRNGCSGLTEIAGVGLDNDGIVDSEFKQQKHCNLRSTTTTLCQPFTTTAFAKRAFRCSAPAVWNSLPKTVLSSDFVAVFKSRIKTFLFSQVFSSLSLSLLTNTLPSPSASEVTTLWRYTNLFIIIIIIVIIIIFLPTSTKPLGRKTRLDIQNYSCNGNLLLPWCCGKKPHFLFAEPWKGVNRKRNVVSLCLLLCKKPSPIK